MKDVMSKLKKDEACQFVDACADWLAKTLCDTAFALWRYNYSYVSKSIIVIITNVTRMCHIPLIPWFTRVQRKRSSNYDVLATKSFALASKQFVSHSTSVIWISSKNFTRNFKWWTKSSSLTGKSTSPELSDRTFFAHLIPSWTPPPPA